MSPRHPGTRGKNLVSLGVVSSEKIKELNHHTRQTEYKLFWAIPMKETWCPEYKDSKRFLFLHQMQRMAKSKLRNMCELSYALAKEK
jgi:hypothetical protein